MIEEGLSGRTTSFDDPVFEGLSGLNAIYPCMMTHEPLDLVIIMLGANDTKDRFNANGFIIGKGLERLTQKAIDTHAAWRNKPNILLVAPPPIHPDYAKTAVAGEMGDKCVERSRALAKEFKEVAARLGCHFIDACSISGIALTVTGFLRSIWQSIYRRLCDRCSIMDNNSIIRTKYIFERIEMVS